MKEILKLEEKGWQALSTAADAARQFYETILCEDAVMVFPGGMLLVGKQSILDSFSAQPWEYYQLTDPRVISLSESSKMLIYRVTAHRKESQPYDALISSTYVNKNGTWKLLHHQQTLV